MTEFQPSPADARTAAEPPAEGEPPARGLIRRVALWVTIGVLIVGAVLGGVFIIVGGQSGIIGRAFLTLLLVGLFALAVLADSAAPDGPNHRWYLPTSTLLNVLLLVIGLIKVWNGPLQPGDTTDGGVWATQISRWIGLVVIVRVALLITQLYVPAFVTRAKNSATRLAGQITVALIWLTALVYVVPLSFPVLTAVGGRSGYPDWWWRISGAAALVAAVCVVIPLVVRAFEPKPARPAVGAFAPPAAASGSTPVYGQSLDYARQQAAWQQYEEQKRAWEALVAQQAGGHPAEAPGPAGSASGASPAAPPAPVIEQPPRPPLPH
ncbi:MAG: hypothetical protein FWD85_07125 [Microbacteriaceae bacterium]|nr:hypothetical protein [Microbacteriaceae bacterium]MCL2795062.1 hypothetical protein [Microbacteriaceae bacterium]